MTTRGTAYLFMLYWICQLTDTRRSNEERKGKHMKKVLSLILSLLVVVSSVGVCFASNSPGNDPMSNKHTYRTVREEVSSFTHYVDQESVNQNNIGQAVVTTVSAMLSVAKITLDPVNVNAIAYSICSGLYGMNGPYRMDISSERVTKYQTYVPTGITTVMWTKLYAYVDYYTWNGSTYEYHHSQTLVHNL